MLRETIRSRLPAGDVVAGARVLWRLPRFLRRPFSTEQARAILRRRLEVREAAFLALVGRAVYRYPRSPYRRLLDLAGCEYGDLDVLVKREGVEGALRALVGRGVYLTVDEFKGRRPVVRGSVSFQLASHDLLNPGSGSDLRVQTSGSRGPPAAVPIDLAFVRDHAINTHLTLDAHGGAHWRHSNWGVPGASSMINVLEFCCAGTPPVRWFLQVDPAAPGLHARYAWSPRALRLSGQLSGVPIPGPEAVPLADPLPIVRWMAAELRDGATPHLWTYASSAVRVCQAAVEAGIDLSGARFTMGGEPLTAARRKLVERSGALAYPRYGTTETDIIGYACPAPRAPDDQHLLHDRLALIQASEHSEQTGLPARSLFVSTVLASAPVILLNVSLGDQAELVRRSCGCALERLGWGVHLHTIRSFEKLNAGGMMFLDVDVMRVLEEVLPARFGGTPTDYQLLEDDEGGLPRLRLLVHPRLGPLEPAAVTDAFLSALGQGSGIERVMSLLWSDAGVVRIERTPPRTTSSGKILHLHLDRGASNPTGAATPTSGIPAAR